MTPRQAWDAALAELDDLERGNVIWRYRNAHRNTSYQITGRRWVPFDELPPATQQRWIDYARKRARRYPQHRA